MLVLLLLLLTVFIKLKQCFSALTVTAFNYGIHVKFLFQKAQKPAQVGICLHFLSENNYGH